MQRDILYCKFKKLVKERRGGEERCRLYSLSAQEEWIGKKVFT